MRRELHAPQVTPDSRVQTKPRAKSCHGRHKRLNPSSSCSSTSFNSQSASQFLVQTMTMAMLSKDQLLHLFNRFSVLISQPDFEKRIEDAVMDKQEAVAVTTAIQEEIFQEMGIDPGFGIACLGKVHMVYDSDRDLMIQFCKFIAREEMACDEAELVPDEFSERMHNQQKLQEQQLEMLKQMRQYHLDDQSTILDKLRLQLENADFETEALVLSSEQIQEIVRRRVSRLFAPKDAS